MGFISGIIRAATGHADNEVISNFSNDKETVRRLLEECNSKLEDTTRSDSSSKNSLEVGDMYFGNQYAEDGASNSVSMEFTQHTSTQIQQNANTMIDQVFNSSASSDVKIDALNTLSKEVENSSAFRTASTTTNSNLHSSDTMESKDIKNIVRMIQVVSTACSDNSMKFGNIYFGDQVSKGQGSTNEVIIKANQSIVTKIDHLKELIESSNHISNKKLKDTLTNEVNENVKLIQKSPVKETVDSISKGVSNGISTFGSTLFKPMTIIATIIIVFILAILAYNIFGKSDDNYEYVY